MKNFMKYVNCRIKYIRNKYLRNWRHFNLLPHCICIEFSGWNWSVITRVSFRTFLNFWLLKFAWSTFGLRLKLYRLLKFSKTFTIGNTCISFNISLNRQVLFIVALLRFCCLPLNLPRTIDDNLMNNFEQKAGSVVGQYNLKTLLLVFQ